jgi:nitrite transporter NirC
MIAETVDKFTVLAREKIDHLEKTPLAVAVSAMMAGAYIGIGLILALSAGSSASPAYRSLLMGLVFGIGLVLVTFSGAELFTGYALYLTFGLLRRRVNGIEALRALLFVWGGNLAGALVLSGIFTLGGDGSLLANAHPFLFDYVGHKIEPAALQLLCRAALCNWLVCLSIWTAARVTNVVAKLLVISWCLIAFVTCGFEHCVANMTAFLLALFAEPGQVALVPGMLRNLLVVTLGNILGGSIFVAIGYVLVGRSDLKRTPEALPARLGQGLDKAARAL